MKSFIVKDGTCRYTTLWNQAGGRARCVLDVSVKRRTSWLGGRLFEAVIRALGAGRPAGRSTASCLTAVKWCKQQCDVYYISGTWPLQPPTFPASCLEFVLLSHIHSASSVVLLLFIALASVCLSVCHTVLLCWNTRREWLNVSLSSSTSTSHSSRLNWTPWWHYSLVTTNNSDGR